MKAFQVGGNIVVKGKSLCLGDMAMDLIPPYSLTASSKTEGIKHPGTGCGVKAFMCLHKLSCWHIHSMLFSSSLGPQHLGGVQQIFVK